MLKGDFVNRTAIGFCNNSTLIAQLEELKQQLSSLLSYLKNNKIFDMESEQQAS